MAYQKTVAWDGANATGAFCDATFLSISAMPQYLSESVEELRWVAHLQVIILPEQRGVEPLV